MGNGDFGFNIVCAGIVLLVGAIAVVALFGGGDDDPPDFGPEDMA